MSTGYGSLADAYARYAALISAQLEAVQQGDVETLGVLDRQRDLLAGEIDALRMGGPVPDPVEAAEAMRQIKTCLESDHRLRQHLSELQDEVLGTAQRLDHQRSAMRVYAGLASAGSNLDVSL